MLQTTVIRPSLQFPVPPLENGDRLSQDEFERRYAAMPTSCKAQLIEGRVYMSAAALRLNSHGRPHGRLMTWLGCYEAATIGTIVGDAITVRLDLENEPQPDLALLIDPRCGGQTQLTNDYVEGAPEFLAEISASTVSIDLGDKKAAYERNGVQEYLVWRVLDQQIDWFWLQNGQYIDLLSDDDDGITRSRIFPGLWLDRTALLNGDMQKVLSVLQLGTSSKEHNEFVVKLGLVE